eukprot:scaffold1150_cov152-Amphora_coffeaeformis.AAC.11
MESARFDGKRPPARRRLSTRPGIDQQPSSVLPLALDPFSSIRKRLARRPVSRLERETYVNPC